MIRWIVSSHFSDEQAEVSLDVKDGNTLGKLVLSGNPEVIEEIGEAFQGAYGAFGHLIREIGDRLSAFDVDAVLQKNFFVELSEGAEVFANGYDPGLGEGEVT